MKNSEINIVLACDKTYLPHAAATLCSIIENNFSPLKIFLLHDGLSKKNINSLRNITCKNKNRFYPIKIKNDLFESMKLTNHFSKTIYYRLLIPDILPIEISKVLYLDCDLLVRKPLDELWNIDLTGKFLAAIENEISSTHKLELGLNINSKYFNSGVLLINVEMWRRELIHKKVVDYVRNNSVIIEYPDQDGLNAILEDNWFELPITWNLQSNYFLTYDKQVRYADIISKTNIVHFTGNDSKPWEFRKELHPFLSEYNYYRNLTPWKKYNLKGKLKHDIKMIIRNIVIFTMFRFSKFGFIRKFYEIICRLIKEVEAKKKDDFCRVYQNNKIISNELISLFPNKKVESGSFKNLIYPTLKAIGSSITPKLIGTYEKELAEVIEFICKNNYSTLIDIGCAEGYYACGLAMRNPKLSVFAFDPNPEARNLCMNMAKENGFFERIEVDNIFTMRSLTTIPSEGHGIIICDCEGDEEYIFYNDGKNWELLINHYDLLMEIHDVFRPGISSYIYDLFCDSHDIKIIYSVIDNLRPKIFKNYLLDEETYETKLNLMAEKRAGIMMWFFMTRKRK